MNRNRSITRFRLNIARRAHWGALLLSLFAQFTVHAQKEVHDDIAAPRRALTEAVARHDAAAVATVTNTEPAPAPQVDRVGFPKDYRTTLKMLGVPARTNTSPAMVLTAYGNDLAASITNAAQLPYPNDSVLVMEFAEALKDSAGKPLLDANGQPQKGQVLHVDVMRRGQGFGEAYGPNRSGQWEFASYYADGTYSTPPAKTASCAQCHQKVGGAKDFVFPLKRANALQN